MEGIDLDFHWQWNFRSSFVVRKGSTPRLELRISPSRGVDIPTRHIDLDINKLLKDRSENEIQVRLEDPEATSDGALDGTITLSLTRNAPPPSNELVTEAQAEKSCGILRAVVYQAKSLNTKHSSYAVVSLPHEVRHHPLATHLIMTRT